MNDHELEHTHFPRLFHRLAQEREVWVDIDLAPHFAHYLMRKHREVWQYTEQETSINPDWETRFYLREKKGHNALTPLTPRHENDVL